ncbi:unnamed protein product [Vitrella brassicaformis CCMP3155]|uniref:Phospholipid/glycerol acyltransferase domain-containing protein n=2 Tax=Vitrella brassicaformis TaxID=1169539 RepID=A0A0G4ETA6_VITBC|nr:unnamed protein product [Vitrella brassicaformis CCMP3155]|eukprot:CEM01539.1 unnamed protein product [Vitrella brassicaformis CCMP3155]
MADVSLFRRGRRVLMSLALLAWAAFIFGSHFIVWVFPLALIMIFFWDKPFHKLIIKVGTTWSRSLTHFGFLRIYATIDPAVYAAVRKAKVRIVVSNHRAELDLVSLPALIGVLDPARCGEQFAIANNVLVERVPVVGWSFHFGGMLSIFYNQKERNARTLDKVVDLLTNGPKSWFFFFPEGNTWSSNKAKRGQQLFEEQIAIDQTESSPATAASADTTTDSGEASARDGGGDGDGENVPNLLPLYWGCYDRLRGSLPVSDDVCWLDVTSATPDVPNRLTYNWRPPYTLLGHPAYPDYLIMNVRLMSASDVSSHESLQRVWARKSRYLDQLAAGVFHQPNEDSYDHKWIRLRASFWSWWTVWGLLIPSLLLLSFVLWPVQTLLYSCAMNALLLTCAWQYIPFYTPPQPEDGMVGSANSSPKLLKHVSSAMSDASTGG